MLDTATFIKDWAKKALQKKGAFTLTDTIEIVNAALVQERGERGEEERKLALQIFNILQGEDPETFSDKLERMAEKQDPGKRRMWLWMNDRDGTGLIYENYTEDEEAGKGWCVKPEDALDWALKK